MLKSNIKEEKDYKGYKCFWGLKEKPDDGFMKFQGTEIYQSAIAQ